MRAWTVFPGFTHNVILRMYRFRIELPCNLLALLGNSCPSGERGQQAVISQNRLYANRVKSFLRKACLYQGTYLYQTGNSTYLLPDWKQQGVGA